MMKGNNVETKMMIGRILGDTEFESNDDIDKLSRATSLNQSPTGGFRRYKLGNLGKFIENLPKSVNYIDNF